MKVKGEKSKDSGIQILMSVFSTIRNDNYIGRII